MLKIARRPPVRSTRSASRTIPALSRKWWSAYWQLAKSKVPEANGNAELSPWTPADLGRFGARLAQHAQRPVEPDHPRTRRDRAVSDQLVARTASDVQEQCRSQ